jgi:predicted metalloprotease
MLWRVERFLSKGFQPPQLKVQINLHKLSLGILLQGVTPQIVAHSLRHLELNNLGDVLIKIIMELGGQRMKVHIQLRLVYTRLEYIQQL